jgi:hypothetical protein
MDSFASIVQADNDQCTSKPTQTFTDELRENPLVQQHTFRGRNQQQGIRAIVDAAMKYTPATIIEAIDPPNVAMNPRAVGENSIDTRNNND